MFINNRSENLICNYLKLSQSALQYRPQLIIRVSLQCYYNKIEGIVIHKQGHN